LTYFQLSFIVLGDGHRIRVAEHNPYCKDEGPKAFSPGLTARKGDNFKAFLATRRMDW
jgi:hypothetical protein